MFSRVPTWHNKRMKQTDLHLDLSNRRTRKRVFLNEMERVVPWTEFVALIAPHAPTKATGRRPFPVEAMLRIHFLQQWFGLSDVAMEEALYDVPLYREFAGLGGMSRLPDRVSILRFRHLLERHQLAEQFLKTVNAQLSAGGYLLKEGTAVDATLIAAPSSTKNKDGERDPEMHQTRKGKTWHFGMKAHIGVDADSGLVHTVVGTAANVSDVTQAHALVHGDEHEVFGDAGYQGVEKREETQDVKARWHIAMRPGKRRALDKETPTGKLRDEIERVKARIRAKVEHPFRVIKRQFGHLKVRYRGLMKNTQQLHTLFALSNLWMVRRHIIKESEV
jgi:IS5 family transposase